MTTSELRTIVSRIQDPRRNEYFEKTSVDGPAFLCAAEVLLSIDTTRQLDVFTQSAIGLRAPYEIKGTKLGANATYLYSAWSMWLCSLACADMGGLPEADLIQRAKIKKALEPLNVYTSGYAKGAVAYSIPDCHYLVPNVQAMAVHMDINREGCLDWLNNNCVNGSWEYATLNNPKEPRKWEDPFHLAMMLYALKCSNLTDEKSKKTIQLLEDNLVIETKHRYPTHKINWHHGFLALACQSDKATMDKCVANAASVIKDHKSNFSRKSFERICTRSSCDQRLSLPMTDLKLIQSQEYNDLCKGASDFNLGTLTFKALEAVLDTIHAVRPLKHHLDVGSQQGQFANHAQLRWKTDTTCLDINKHTVSQGRKRFPHLKFKCLDFSELEGCENKFDLVTNLHWFFYYGQQRRKKAYEKFKSILTEEGCLVFAHGDVNWETKHGITHNDFKQELEAHFQVQAEIRTCENLPLDIKAHTNHNYLGRTYSILVARP